MQPAHAVGLYVKPHSAILSAEMPPSNHYLTSQPMKYPFRVKRRVRFGDCDPGGVLYTPNIGFYVTESIREFMDHVMGAPFERAVLNLGVLPPAKSISVEFLSFMKWDDELEISVAVKEIGNTSYTFAVHGYCIGTPVFIAEFTQVCVDPDTKRPTPIPQALRLALGQHSNV